MLRKSGFTLVISFAFLAACQSQGGDGLGGSASLDTEGQKASYGIGHQMGSQLAPAEGHIDLSAFLAGVRDGMAGNDPAVPQDQIEVALQTLNEVVREEETQRREAEGEKNSAEGEAFLAENASKEGVIVTESGLQYEVLREGEGVTPSPEDRVSIHYKGTLLDGTQFDSSYDRGQPATFGVTGVIPGFSEGLQLMNVGSHYRFFIPSEIGYGPNGSGRVIGPNATLVFEVELLEIVE
jgi:FKBP-type peptidyl-prolyl cis-trans isomerase